MTREGRTGRRGLGERSQAIPRKRESRTNLGGVGKASGVERPGGGCAPVRGGVIRPRHRRGGHTQVKTNT